MEFPAKSTPIFVRLKNTRYFIFAVEEISSIFNEKSARLIPLFLARLNIGSASCKTVLRFC